MIECQRFPIHLQYVWRMDGDKVKTDGKESSLSSSNFGVNRCQPRADEELMFLLFHVLLLYQSYFYLILSSNLSILILSHFPTLSLAFISTYSPVTPQGRQKTRQMQGHAWVMMLVGCRFRSVIIRVLKSEDSLK